MLMSKSARHLSTFRYALAICFLAFYVSHAKPIAETAIDDLRPRASSLKRGLIYIPRDGHPEDDRVWIQPGSSLTWYYNYGPDPTNIYSSRLQHVPMIFGPYYNDFASKIRARIAAGGKVPQILAYNEPDQPYEYGGSNADPVVCAQHWISELEPLRRDFGIELGAPAVSGAEYGWTWLQKFFTACAGRCHPTFLPVHWYGGFQGIADHLGRARGTYPNMTLWVTEWAPANQGLRETQANFNTSVEYMDRLDYVQRYSYFGSFRSDVSNVGANVSMLDPSGRLTDIGAWYLNVRK